jgi:predicted outer membrane repeat protein
VIPLEGPAGIPLLIRDHSIGSGGAIYTLNRVFAEYGAIEAIP